MRQSPKTYTVFSPCVRPEALRIPCVKRTFRALERPFPSVPSIATMLPRCCNDVDSMFSLHESRVLSRALRSSAVECCESSTSSPRRARPTERMFFTRVCRVCQLSHKILLEPNRKFLCTVMIASPAPSPALSPRTSLRASLPPAPSPNSPARTPRSVPPHCSVLSLFRPPVCAEEVTVLPSSVS